MTRFNLALRTMLISAGLAGSPAHAALLQLEGTFLGFFVSGTPYSVLTGGWSAAVDTAGLQTLPDPNGFVSLKVRPDSIVFDQAQTFVPNPSNPAASTTWTTANTMVEVSFFRGVATGDVVVSGDVPQNFSSTFSSAGTGFNDFELRYTDQRLDLATREPLDLFKYNLQGIGDFGATRQGDRVNPIPNTLANGGVSVTELQSVAPQSGVVEFFGGADGVTLAGLSIDFAADETLQVSVNPAASLSVADLFVFNTFSTQLQAWDIEVVGNLNGTSTIYIPYATGADPLELKIFHFDDDIGLWELLPTTVDTANRWLVATTDSFSPVVAVNGLNNDEALLALTQLNARDLPLPGSLTLVGVALCLLRWSRVWTRRRVIAGVYAPVRG